MSWEFTLPETNSSHLKMRAPWKFGDSYWKPPFLGAMVVFGGVKGTPPQIGDP